MKTVDRFSRIRLQLAIALARDIIEYRNGDPTKFARMVDSHGKQICTSENHAAVAIGIATDHRVRLAYPVASRMLTMLLLREV